MKIVIGADIVPRGNNLEGFVSGNMKKVVDQKLLDRIKKFDYRIFNLETPLCEKETPISKCGPNHITSPEAVNGFQCLQIDFLTLANNHILDQGKEGLMKTLDVLNHAAIAYAGAGEYQDAIKPHIFGNKKEKVGVYCCAEHEFTIVSDREPGANPYDPLRSFDEVEKLKQGCDYVIVLYHGGKEYYQYPSPNLQSICRKFVDKGADLVLCQHSHCIGTAETYMSGTIVYGQGNFLFHDPNNPLGTESLLISVDTKNRIIEYIPIINNNGAIRLSTQMEHDEILSQFEARGENLQEDHFIETNYKKFADAMFYSYLNAFSGNRFRNICFRGINHFSKGKLLKKVINSHYKKSNILQLQNYIDCEAHRELVLAALKSQTKN